MYVNLFSDISIEQRELLETFVFVLRSKEELRILQREMENYLAYYRDSVVVLRRKIKEASGKYPFKDPLK